MISLQTNQQKINYLVAKGYVTVQELAYIFGCNTHHVNQMAKGKRPGGQKIARELDRMIQEFREKK